MFCELAASTTIGGETVARFRTELPEHDDSLLPLLREHVPSIRVASTASSGLSMVALEMLPWVLILGAWWWISRRAVRIGAGSLTAPGKHGRKFDESKPKTSFSDIAGLTSAKRDLEEVVAFLNEPEKFRKLGGRIPRGVLLVGPPGTGKTLLARAVAGEVGVPFFSINGSEFVEMFVGVGASRVRELFDTAKKAGPAIVFIDEVDAVGRTRGGGIGGGNDEREQTLNQLLSEMDGFDQHDPVVVVAATNRPDVLDPALLRPGRFDRRVVIDLPDRTARRAILDIHTRGKPIDSDVALDEIAATTPGFSGADLSNLVNEAALSATRRNADTITRGDFAAAYDKIVLGDPRAYHAQVAPGRVAGRLCQSLGRLQLVQRAGPRQHLGILRTIAGGRAREDPVIESLLGGPVGGSRLGQILLRRVELGLAGLGLAAELRTLVPQRR